MSVDQYVLASAVVAALNRLADAEMRKAKAALPGDEVSEERMHHHAERCLREAAKTIERVAGV